MEENSSNRLKQNMKSKKKKNCCQYSETFKVQKTSSKNVD